MWLLFTTILLVVIYRLLRRPSRLEVLGNKFPGPICWPLIQNALEFGYKTTDLPDAGERLFRTYGPRIRLWIANGLYIMLADCKDAEVILGSNTLLNKARDYDFLKPWIGTGLLTSTGNKWRKHRKILTPTFHFKILEEFVEVFDANGEILVDILKKEVADGPSFDVYNYVTLYALDNVCETAMGLQMNAQQDRNSAYVRAVRDMSELLMERTYRPWLRPDFLFRLFPQGKLHDKSIKVLHQVSNSVVKTRKAELLSKRDENINVSKQHDDSGVKKRLAFLDLLLEASFADGELTDEDIREEVDTFMFEGHDTTSSAISFSLYLLSLHQDVQNKVFAELTTIFPEGSPHTPLNYRHLHEMKYLERVVKEALRLFPSVPLFARDVTEDIKLPDGLVVPRGSTVLILPAVTHRHPEVFEDPETFDPDRFLPENAQGRHPYAYIPFSAGPRNCIGQKFAMMELKAAVSHVVRHFRVLPAPEEEGIQLAPELILKSKNGFRILLTTRPSKK